MPAIYVKPAPGGRIRMPERNSMPMPEAGAWVDRTDFYERLLIGGDVIECSPPPPATEPEATAANDAPAASALPSTFKPSKEK